MISIIRRLILFPYAGVLTIACFLGWVLLAELGPTFLPPDEGAFLYVTFHFILNPLLGICVGILIVLHSLLQPKSIAKVLGVVLSIIPLLVTYVGVTGATWLTEMLGVRFQ